VAAKPNIVVFITDDESWQERSAYGWSKIPTPNFDRVARDGVLFTRGYTSAPSCAPSRAALLTGRNFWELEEGAFIQAFAKQIGDIALLTAAIMAAVFFTILLVSGNTMAQGVRERTGELGVLKALGFTNGRVMTLVLLESCLMAVLGGAIGLGLAWVMISRGDPTGGMLPLFMFPVKDLFVGLAIAAGLGLATGIFPALQAMRLRVADALRRM
jgi:hypothetical protein